MLEFAACCVLATQALPAQTVGSVMVGYAAGIDAPALRDGSIGLGLAAFRDRARGLEVGVIAGADRHESRRLRTDGLYFDAARPGTSVLPCPGCVPGSLEQRLGESAGYITGALRARLRTGWVRPWVAIGGGLYHLRRSSLVTFSGGTLREFGISNDRSAEWRPGGHAGVGLSIPVRGRVQLELLSQLHGALSVGNDYVGGAAYARFATGITVR